VSSRDITPESWAANEVRRISRRSFLSRAAVGAAAMAAPGVLQTADGWAGVPEDVAMARGPGGSVIRAFEGALVGLTESSLVLQVAGKETEVPATASATLWKGEDTGMGSFAVGDDVLVRTVDGGLTNAWANLIKVRGEITAAIPGGYEVLGGDGKSIGVLFDGATRSEDALSSRPTVPGSLPLGSYLDVAGLRVDGYLRASTARYVTPGALEPQGSGAPVASDANASGPSPLVTFIYTNMASWFTCSTGAGRCGTCNTGNSSQLAWPALDTCGCCSGSCCDCAKNCMSQVYLSCGSCVIVKDPCTNISNTCHVVDCGPCNNTSCAGSCSPNTCGHTCTECGVPRTTPVVDLTKPTFATFRNPASFGCMLANVMNCV
jgi:hypothetical protein